MFLVWAVPFDFPSVADSLLARGSVERHRIATVRDRACQRNIKDTPLVVPGKDVIKHLPARGVPVAAILWVAVVALHRMPHNQRKEFSLAAVL